MVSADMNPWKYVYVALISLLWRPPILRGTLRLTENQGSILHTRLLISTHTPR